MNLGTNILKKIKKGKIKPKAKWIFAFQNILAWSLGIISLMISSLAVSVIINIINNNDYGLFRMIHPSPTKIIIQTLPYFWIIGLIIFIFIFRYTLKQTKDGYKVEIYKIVIISIILSVVLGGFFYYLGIGDTIDNSLSQRLPFYNQIMGPRHLMWLQEDEGMLVGQIISLIDQNNFKLEDFNHKQWKIVKTENKIVKPKFKKIIPSVLDFELRPGLEIRAFGEKIDNNTFQALIIKPAPPGPCPVCPIKPIRPMK